MVPELAARMSTEPTAARVPSVSSRPSMEREALPRMAARVVVSIWLRPIAAPTPTPPLDCAAMPTPPPTAIRLAVSLAATRTPPGAAICTSTESSRASVTVITRLTDTEPPMASPFLESPVAPAPPAEMATMAPERVASTRSRGASPGVPSREIRAPSRSARVSMSSAL